MIKSIKIIFTMVFVLFFIIIGCGGITPDKKNNPSSKILNNDLSQLQPGLSVIYIFKKYRNINQIPVGAAALRMGQVGEPIPIINHQSRKNESVFTSVHSQGVAMVMDGFLKLTKTGVYRWRALSNDGVRMFINNIMIFEDPGVHGDRLTPAGTLQISKSGMLPVRIVYFQRKGTAALKLYWQSPGTDKFSLVPADVYFHQP